MTYERERYIKNLKFKLSYNWEVGGDVLQKI